MGRGNKVKSDNGERDHEEKSIDKREKQKTNLIINDDKDMTR